MPMPKSQMNMHKPLTLMWTSRNSAPIEWTCSFTASLVSNARTMAPMLRAVPIADRPATPPPITRTLAGGTFPAAVIWPITNRKDYKSKLLGQSNMLHCKHYPSTPALSNTFCSNAGLKRNLKIIYVKVLVNWFYPSCSETLHIQILYHLVQLSQCNRDEHAWPSMASGEGGSTCPLMDILWWNTYW